MHPSSGSTREAAPAQGAAQSFPLPQFLDSDSVAEKIGSGPAHHTPKEPAASTGTNIASSQHRHSFANEHNQLASQPVGDAPSMVVTSANASLSGLRNQPGSTTTPTMEPAGAAAGFVPLPGGPLSSPALPLSPSSAVSDAVLSSVEVAASPAWHHALVVFDKLFCVCYVPPKMRAITQVGELVLCEFGGSENVATVVADVSSLVADVVAAREAGQHDTSLEDIFSPPVDRGLSSTTPSSSHSSAFCAAYPPLYREPPTSGRASERTLCRLPCVLRRGTNRDKKRVYFSRLRSSDALTVAQRLLSSEQVVAVSAEYQVNFACATIYLAGEREECQLTDQQFQQLGNAMLEPLRCDVVEFRFWSERNHGELDLTRRLVGKEYSEALHDKVTEHLRTPVGKATQAAARAAGQTGGAGQPPAMQQQPPPPPPPPLQPHQLALANHPGGAAAMMMRQRHAFPAGTAWAHSMATVPTVTVLQPAAATANQPGMGYALRPSIYIAPPPAQPGMQPLSPPPPHLTVMQPSAFQSVPQMSAPPGAFPVNPPSSPFYTPSQAAQQQQQAQQQALALSSGSVGGAPVYYVMPTPTAVQWDHAQRAVSYVEHLQPHHYLQQLSPSTPPAMTQMTPTLIQTSDAAPAQQQQQQQQQQQGSSVAYVPGSAVNMQGYQTVSYPVVFNGVTYSPYQR